jgi:hypothetical protein
MSRGSSSFFITTGPGNFVYYSVISKEETIEFFDILKGDREMWRGGGEVIVGQRTEQDRCAVVKDSPI